MSASDSLRVAGGVAQFRNEYIRWTREAETGDVIYVGNNFEGSVRLSDVPRGEEVQAFAEYQQGQRQPS